MKVAFVHKGRENLGIEYLSAVLKKAGHETYLAFDPGVFGTEDNVFWVPFLERAFDQKQRVLQTIEESNADLVAFSIYTSTYRWACDIARTIKEKHDVKIVFGGVHATLVPEHVIRNDFVDFVIVGEGEYPLLELVESLESNALHYGIQNVWCKQSGKIIRNKIRGPIENLDSLPTLDKALFEKGIHYGDDYMALTSRGCMFDCSFCCESYYNKLYGNRYYRRRSVDSTIEELSYMKKRYGFKEVIFFDGIFCADAQWLRAFLDRYNRQIRVPFKCMGHVNLFNEEIARLLKDSRCYCVNFGIQSMSEKVRRDVLNRYETNSKIWEAFRICDRFKLRYDVDLMIGLPLDVIEEDYFTNAARLKQAKFLNRIKFFHLSYYPKIQITEVAKEKRVLDGEDIADIENGKSTRWFGIDQKEDRRSKMAKESASVFCKILPLLPNPLVRIILKFKLYKRFYLIPSCIVIFVQVVIGVKNRDLRFEIYFKKYARHIKQLLATKLDKWHGCRTREIGNGKKVVKE